MADNASPDGPAERVDHLATGRIIGKNIGQEPDIEPGAIYIGNQPSNDIVIIIQEFGGIAVDRGPSAESLRQSQRGVARVYWGDRRCHELRGHLR